MGIKIKQDLFPSANKGEEPSQTVFRFALRPSPDYTLR